MTVTTLRYWAFPDYWNERVREFDNVFDLLAEIGALDKEHTDKELNCKDANERYGMCVEVENDAGEILQVGVTNEGWIIMYLPENDVGAISVGDENATGNVTFSLPDYVEFSRQHLLRKDEAKEVIRVWCETNQLSQKVLWRD